MKRLRRNVGGSSPGVKEEPFNTASLLGLHKMASDIIVDIVNKILGNVSISQDTDIKIQDAQQTEAFNITDPTSQLED